MRVNTMLSSLSIAAIALLAAVTPGVAQAQTNGPRDDASSFVATAGNDLTPSINMSKAVAGDGRIVTSDIERNFNLVAPAKPRVPLSASAFKVSTSSAIGDDKLSFGQQPELIQTPSAESWKPYQADVDLRIERSKRRIEFVPSSGLKMPYQVPYPN